MRLPLRKTVATLTLSAFAPIATMAQQPVQSSSRQSAVVAKVATLRAGDKISVVLTHAAERYGTFQSPLQDGFTFHDVDQNADVMFLYADVKKVKNGYGGYNSVTHKHTDHTKVYVWIGIATGVIVGVVVAAAAAKN
jgi:hypothetical protein